MSISVGFGNGRKPTVARGVILACFLGAISTASAADGSIPTAVCFNQPIPEKHALAELNSVFASTSVYVDHGRACGGDAGYRCRVVARKSRVFLVLETPSGRRLGRHIPWLTKGDRHAFTETARLGKTRELAVLIEGLVAEHRAVELALLGVRSVSGVW